MIKINLMPKVEIVPKKPRITLPPIAITDVVGALLLIITLLWIFFSCAVSRTRIATTKYRIEKTKVELAKLEEAVKRVDYLRKREAELKALINEIENLKPLTVREVIILDEIAKILPPYIWINKFNHNSEAKTISLEGTTFSALSLADFITNIKKSELFSDATFKSFTKKTEEKVEVIIFQLEIKVNPDVISKVFEKEE